jgi:hypothetical protein
MPDDADSGREACDVASAVGATTRDALINALIPIPIPIVICDGFKFTVFLANWDWVERDTHLRQRNPFAGRR